MLCLGSMEMDPGISNPCYKETILQRNYWKMTIVWSFSFNFVVKFHCEKLWNHSSPDYIEIRLIMRSVIKGLHCLS